MPLFNFQYFHPILSFFLYAVCLAIMMSIAFAIDDHITWNIRYKERKERYKIKILVHFCITILVVFTTLTFLYYMFGLGSNYFPLCEYKKLCKKN